jgi:glycosyltransferase involved in cell wall biosynthesis
VLFDLSYKFIENLDKNTEVTNNLLYIQTIKELSKQFDVVFTSLANDSWLKKYAEAVRDVKGKIVFEMNENPHSIVASRRDLKIVLALKRWFFLNFSLKNVDGFIVISRSLEDLFLKHKSNNTLIIRVPILATNRLLINSNRSKLNLKYIFHAGSLSEQKDGIKAMFTAFHIAKQKLKIELKLYLAFKTGLPKLLKWINSFVDNNNLKSDVVFTGLLVGEQLDEYYDKCSLAIINKPVNIQNDYNFSTKLTELIPRGIPLIISKTGEHNYYFKHNYNCYLVEPDNQEEIAEGIVKIINNPEYSEMITKNALQLIDSDFYYLNHASNLFDFFMKVKLNELNK